jgi:hypothetical protein
MSSMNALTKRARDYVCDIVKAQWVDNGTH